MRVLNRGYSEKKKEWKTAEGKAYFVKESDRIFELDQRNYEYAIISGPSKSYLWILARTPELEPGLKAKTDLQGSGTWLRHNQADIA